MIPILNFELYYIDFIVFDDFKILQLFQKNFFAKLILAFAKNLAEVSTQKSNFIIYIRYVIYLQKLQENLSEGNENQRFEYLFRKMTFRFSRKRI